MNECRSLLEVWLAGGIGLAGMVIVIIHSLQQQREYGVTLAHNLKLLQEANDTTERYAALMGKVVELWDGDTAE